MAKEFKRTVLTTNITAVVLGEESNTTLPIMIVQGEVGKIKALKLAKANIKTDIELQEHIMETVGADYAIEISKVDTIQETRKISFDDFMKYSKVVKPKKEEKKN